MKYKLKCPECKKQITVSTKDAVKYVEKGVVLYSFDCPICDEEITGTKLNVRSVE